ncbi:conserved hypothetical protein [Vibrio owensii]|uniref:Uncharacterized protein n=1 Tax=Vibrio owensii CAIM 1854 = LMG 25443 TaxID=1229493 RepID=A0A0C1VNK2_9VIBR|nr:hypothetical protein H735_19865 [Vibrio owensii CAIM 1854 = LMG 25443]CAH1529058.1 conserved hypothetical protein [Vibrio owensii]CAH1570913.1 conserved hypothetical protein [Vibrio owensii]
MTNAKVPYKLLIQILFLTPKTQQAIKHLKYNYLDKNNKAQFEVDRRLWPIGDESLKGRS